MSTEEEMSSTEAKLLDPGQVRLHRGALGHLALEYGDQHYERVRPVRAYPLTSPWEYIALVDGEEQEIGILRRVEELDRPSQEALVQELEGTYFIPQITQILRIETYLGITRWEVETDRGLRNFEIRDRDDVRRLSSRRFLVRDVDGNRYEIADISQLDARSQELLYQIV